MTVGASDVFKAQADTIQAFLERGGRDHVPLRRGFLQKRVRGGGAGPLAAFVHERRGRALDLYLLLHAVASSEPWDARFAAAVWVRALGLSPSKNAETMISRQWTWLETNQLVTSARRNRLRELTLLREDGSGLDYQHPGRKEGDYFKLPRAYWDGGFHYRLGLPAKALLLIALSLQDGFTLPFDRGAVWYGMSRDSLRTGLHDLETHNLLDWSAVTRSAPLTRRGFTYERHYTLRSPFSVAPVAGPTATKS